MLKFSISNKAIRPFGGPYCYPPRLGQRPRLQQHHCLFSECVCHRTGSSHWRNYVRKKQNKKLTSNRADQLAEFGINCTLIGHSERRDLYGETNSDVAKKVQLSLENNLQVVLCIGEHKEDRESGNTNTILQQQLEPVIGVVGNNWSNIVIAYEPVWAIGTGLSATPQMAQDTHSFIRTYLKEHVSSEVAEATRIIYGGSVKGSNCEELIQQADIDGFLVGGASLKEDISQIVTKSQEKF